MSRSVEEWIGKSDDTVPPPRVRLRVFDASGGRCYLCSRKIAAGEYWQADHVIALCNGGNNRESNLRAACRNCCYGKTADDLAFKSAMNKKRSKHLGIKKSKPLSKWKRKVDGTTVLR